MNTTPRFTIQVICGDPPRAYEPEHGEAGPFCFHCEKTIINHDGHTFEVHNRWGEMITGPHYALHHAQRSLADLERLP